MNPPSDVTVLSVIEPSPSLLPLLLEALDISLLDLREWDRGGTGALGRSAGRVPGGDDFVGVGLELDTDARRGSGV